MGTDLVHGGADGHKAGVNLRHDIDIGINHHDVDDDVDETAAGGFGAVAKTMISACFPAIRSCV